MSGLGLEPTEEMVDAPELTGDTRHPVLEVRGLVVDFDGFKAIDGVDFTVNKGEVRFIIGPNGAGKTTLIDVVTGLTKAAEGTVTFDGQDITRTKEYKVVRLGIGRSFQTPTVFEHLTVVENLDLSASFRMSMVRLMRRRRGVSETVSRTLGRIGLSDKAESLAGSLSHGQKQWLEIGMLLVQEPKLLLLDEPVAGMSTSERIATGELLLDLAGDHTVVVVEHDMAFLRRFASVVTVMHEGKILSEGSVQEVQSDERVREVYLGRSRDERSGAVES
jgi:urea transport system ATP-binding protein